MKTAVVGLGSIGSVHIEVLKKLKFNISSICDIDREKLNIYNEICGFTDFKAMIEQIKPDVIHLCTPHYLHADMIVYALERDINVICEKPICISENDFARILNAESKSRGQLGICFQNRYNPATIFLKKYLDKKKVLCANALLSWNRDESYYRSGSWRGQYSTEGGGLLINQSIHTLDLLQYLFGMPKQVVAQCANLTLKDYIEVEDTACALYKGDIDYSFFATNGSSQDVPIYINVKTEDGYLQFFDGQIFFNGEKIFFDDNKKYYGKGVYGNGHEKLFIDFYDCVKTGRKFEICGQEALKSVSMVLSAYKSNGKIINI